MSRRIHAMLRCTYTSCLGVGIVMAWQCERNQHMGPLSTRNCRCKETYLTDDARIVRRCQGIAVATGQNHRVEVLHPPKLMTRFATGPPARTRSGMSYLRRRRLSLAEPIWRKR